VTDTPNLDDREGNLRRWWDALSPDDRVQARASLDGYLPRELVLSLTRAGVLVASQAYWTSVQSGPSGFPVPADVAEFIRSQD